MENNVKLNTSICGVTLKNPVIAASGTFGFGREYARLFNISQLGGISVKGLTIMPREGNPPPRVAETTAGMLNSVGLQNPGVDVFLNEELPWLKKQDTMIMANIAGNTLEDYAAIAKKLAGSQIDMIELNISCPNVKQGGMAFGTRPNLVYEVTKHVKNSSIHPVIVKLSPNVSDIAEIAQAAEEAGADGISLINTITGMAVDPYKRKPILSTVTGGLSGKAVMPVALRMVWQVHKAVKLPIIGMGGITTGADAASFMLCGASAVMVGTAGLSNPKAWLNIIEELKEYCVTTETEDISSLVGALEC